MKHVAVEVPVVRGAPPWGSDCTGEDAMRGEIVRDKAEPELYVLTVVVWLTTGLFH